MAEYYQIDFNSDIYFTDTGQPPPLGSPCRCKVTGLDALTLLYAGSIAVSANGTPYLFKIPHAGQGTIIQIAPFVLTKNVLDDITALINEVIEDDVTIRVNIAGDIRTYDLNCMPFFPKPVEFSGEFLDNQIFDSAINLIVLSQNT